MRSIRWADAIRLLSLLTTAFFVVAAVLQVVLAFELTGARPFGGVDFIDETIRVFAWEQGCWPMEFASTALFGLGFMTLAGLGILLARLGDRADARRRLTAAAFLGAGGIGAATQLMWLGVKPIATSPQYCECGFRQEEIVSRLMILDVAGTVQVWMVLGAVVLIAVAALLTAGLARDAGMPQTWVWLSYAIAVASLASATLAILGAFPYDQFSVLLTAGVLLPIWAVWLATRAPTLVQFESMPYDEETRGETDG